MYLFWYCKKIKIGQVFSLLPSVVREEAIATVDHLEVSISFNVGFGVIVDDVFKADNSFVVLVSPLIKVVAVIAS